MSVAKGAKQSHTRDEIASQKFTHSETSLLFPFFFACFEYGEECFLRDVDLANRLHAFLAFLLLFPKLALAGDIAAVAFCRDVLPHRANRFARDNFATDSGLQRHFEHVARDLLLE